MRPSTPIRFVVTPARWNSYPSGSISTPVVAVMIVRLVPTGGWQRMSQRNSAELPSARFVQCDSRSVGGDMGDGGVFPLMTQFPLTPLSVSRCRPCATVGVVLVEIGG